MKSDRATLTAKRSIVYVLMIVFTIIAVVPIYLMLINATRSNAQINEGLSFLPGGNTMTNWKNLTNRNFQIWQGFSNSAFISVCCTVLVFTSLHLQHMQFMYIDLKVEISFGHSSLSLS